MDIFEGWEYVERTTSRGSGYIHGRHVRHRAFKASKAGMDNPRENRESRRLQGRKLCREALKLVHCGLRTAQNLAVTTAQWISCIIRGAGTASLENAHAIIDIIRFLSCKPLVYRIFKYHLRRAQSIYHRLLDHQPQNPHYSIQSFRHRYHALLPSISPSKSSQIFQHTHLR